MVYSTKEKDGDVMNL